MRRGLRGRAGGDGGVALRSSLLNLDWPSPDRWSEEQRLQFNHTLRTLARAPDVTGVILTGRELFDASSDGAPYADDPFDDLLARIADSPIPVVAAIPGDAAGAGLELAIACAARVGASNATYSLPTIESARLPGLQTLRALPRLVGVEAAARMVALGRPLRGDEAKSLGLIDAHAGDDPVVAAARLLAAWLGSDRHIAVAPDPIEVQAKFFLARRMLRDTAAHQTAPLSAVRAMEAAVQMRPRQAKVEVSRIACELEQSEQGAALRYAARALDGLSGRLSGLARVQARLAQRIWWPMAREAIHLLDEGASPAQVDRCFMEFGFPAGPFAKSDVRGFEAVFTAGDGVLASGGDWAVYSPTLDLMADAGRVGGEAPGWYRPVADGSRTRFEPAVDQLIQSSAISQRLRRSPISDEAVMRRCLNAAVNAAFAAPRALGDPSLEDIDAIWLEKLGFPRWKGGLIYHARARGLGVVVSQLTGEAARRNTAGAISDHLVAAAKDGELLPSLAMGQRG